jgi:hypothetical protein
MSEDALRKIKSFSGPKESAQILPAIGTTALQTKTTYNTAVSVREPRNMVKIRDNVLLEAQLAGEGFFYRWVVKNRKTGKKKVIEGPTIDLAMCLARNYGNAAIEVEMQETTSHYVFTAALIDLETGFTSPRLFKQRKSQSMGDKYDKDRQSDIVFQIGQSKAIRNAIIKSMPGWLVDRAIQVAKDAELKTIKPEHLAEAREKVVAFFEGYGISRERLERKLEKPIEQMTAQDVLDMRGEARAIKDGHITPRELFPDEEDDNQGDMREPPSAPEPPKETEQPSPPPPAEKQPLEEPDPPPQESPTTTAAPTGIRPIWDKSVWGRMRKGNPPKTGFAAWLISNKDTLRDAPDNIKKQLIDKWHRCYGDVPFPLRKERSDKGTSVPQELPPGFGDNAEPTSPMMETDGPEPPPWTQEPPAGEYQPGNKDLGKAQPQSEPTEPDSNSDGIGYDHPRFQNIHPDIKGKDLTRSMMNLALSSDFLLDVWDKMMQMRTIADMAEVQRCTMFLKNQAARKGQTLGSSKVK